MASEDEKAEISSSYNKKVLEMQEIQTSSNYVTNACDIYGVKLADARSARAMPKAVVQIMNDTRLGEKCNYENFASKESVEELNQRIFKDRVFLVQNRSK